MRALRDVGRPLMAVVAEDDVEVRYSVAVHLRRLGLEVREAGNGDETMALMKARRPDLLCLDLSMPVVSGYAVLRWIHGDAELRSIPVVVVTGRVGLDDYATCREFGAAAVIEKPFRAKSLIATVRRLLDLPGANDPASTAPPADEPEAQR